MNKINFKPRWILWLLLVISGAGIIMGSSSDGDVQQGKHVRRVPPAALSNDAGEPDHVVVAMSNAESDRVELERLSPASAGNDAGGSNPAGSNLFGATSWAAPPPPAPVVKVMAPPEPPAPTAPPMPFNYLGIYHEGKVHAAVLSKGDQVYTVAPGDVIDGTYRIESFRDKDVELNYLPLNIRQTVTSGGA
jgi:hypothetical protein